MCLPPRLLIAFLIFIHLNAAAQDLHCRIFFTDKGAQEKTPPEGFFTPESIQRRALLGISWSEEDLPLCSEYVDRVRTYGLPVFQSRWFNMLSLETDSSRLETIASLPFVADVQCAEVEAGHFLPATNHKELEITEEDSALLALQTAHLEAEMFRKKGLNGTGIRIAVLDIGFKDLQEVPALKHLKIIESRDFMSRKSKVFTYNDHGTQALSCLAGIHDGIPLGLAPSAQYLLARTERHGEYRTEEESWIEAAEWADQMGARIISSSLGYSWQRYWKKDMNGQTALVSKAAAIATAKGMFIVASAGNAGETDWRIIGAPADSDSVLAVGGVEPETGYHISFSSFGPNTLNHIKPNVSAFGRVYAGTPYGLEQAEGTSFSCPLISGFAACLLQSDSTLSPWALRNRIEQAGHLYPYYDYAHGYGVPKASRALLEGGSVAYPDSMLDFMVNSLGIGIYCKYPGNDSDSGYLSPHDEHWYLYYHISDTSGKILRYRVVQPFQLRLENDRVVYREVPDADRPTNAELDALFIPYESFEKPFVVRASFLGIHKSFFVE